MASNKDSGSSKKPELFSTEFTIIGKVPRELFSKFLEAQVNMLGIRGWVQETDDGTIKGHIEGKKPNLDKLKDVVKAAEQFASKVTDVVFGEMKKIEDFTFPKFEVKC